MVSSAGVSYVPFSIPSDVSAEIVTRSLHRLGPMLIGFVLDTILYGVVVTQSLVYFSCYKRYVRSS